LAFLLLAVIERRGLRPAQRRLPALAAGAVTLIALALAVLTLRALAQALIFHDPIAETWLYYFEHSFYPATFYVAIMIATCYGIRAWAIDEQRRAAATRLETAVARAELKSIAGRLQPHFVSDALSHISATMSDDPLHARRVIADLGDLLHRLLARMPSEHVTLGDELNDITRMLTFQQTILPGRLRFTIDAGAEARREYIPTFAVQSLVQQMLAHDGPLALTIEARCTAGTLRVVVRNEDDPAETRSVDIALRADAA
jgi:LytS/YehU family sensor histidine kinase